MPVLRSRLFGVLSYRAKEDNFSYLHICRKTMTLSFLSGLVEVRAQFLGLNDYDIFM